MPIDSRLNFKRHSDLVTSKSSSALGFVKRFSREIEDKSTLKAINSAFVRSNLDYASTVWINIPSIKSTMIESIQKRFTMFAFRQYPNTTNNYQISSYVDRLSDLNMTKLSRRRINFALLLLYDLITDQIHCPFVKGLFYINPNPHNFRNAELFRICNFDLSMNANAPITQMCKYANLIKTVFTDSVNRNDFKRKLIILPDSLFLTG